MTLALATANVRARPATYAGTAAAVVLAAALLALCAALFAAALAATGDDPAADYTGPIAVFATLGAIAVFAASFVLASTVTLGVRHRHRELALLRTVGATPAQVRRLITRETGVVALLATAGGATAGLLAAPVAARVFARAAEIPDAFRAPPRAFPVLLACAAVLLVTWVAAWAAGRRAGRADPVAGLAQAATGRFRMGPLRVLAGLLALGGATVLLAVAIGLDDPGLGLGFAFMDSSLALVGVALLMPVVVRPALALLAPLARWSRTGAVAADDLHADTWRAAATATPVALMVTLTATMTQAGRGTAALGEQGTQLWSLSVIVVIALGFAAVAVANTTAMTVLARRADLAALRLAGATAAQVASITRWAALLGALAGALLGTLLSATAVLAFAAAAGIPVGAALDAPLYLALTAAAAAVAAIASDLATRAALRPDRGRRRVSGRTGPARSR